MPAWPARAADRTGLVAAYTVVLDAPSAGERISAARRESERDVGPRASAASVDLLRRRVASRQVPVLDGIEALGVQVTGSVQKVLNAIFIRATPEQARAAARIPGVRRVVRSRPVQSTLNRVGEIVGTAAARNRPRGLALRGEGIKVAILDSGIDIEHEAFRDETLPPLEGFPKGDPDLLRFASRKVVAVRSYVRLLNSADPETSTPDARTLDDFSGHGTGVAMAAAGRGVLTPLGMVEGIAPKARIGVYKLFGTPGINDGPDSNAVIAAIDDAVGDGMDIISMSFGHPSFVRWDAYGEECHLEDPGEPCDPSAIAAQSAVEDFGRVVVRAAGNLGASGVVREAMLNTTDMGANAPGVIAVGATGSSRWGYQGVRVGNRTFPAYSGSGPEVDRLLAAPAFDTAALDNRFGCVPFGESALAGRIALVSAGGGCEAVRKVEQADAAGALAVVLISEAYPYPAPDLEMTDIPAYMIDSRDGLALRRALRGAGPAVALVAGPFERFSHGYSEVLAPFSSRGPTPALGLKPDIVAPGFTVYTADLVTGPQGRARNPSGFRETMGTSYAAPLVAGAAALVWQAHPRFSARQVASALINSASQEVFDEGGPARVTSVGGGLLNIPAALDPIATVVPPTVSFGQLAEGEIPVDRSIGIANHDTVMRTYSLRVEARDWNPSAKVTVNGARDLTIDVLPGTVNRVRVALEGSMPSPGSYEGHLRLSDGRTERDLRVPFLYVVGDGVPSNGADLSEPEHPGAYGRREVRIVVAKVVDRHGVPVAGHPVEFEVFKGFGEIMDSTSETTESGLAFAEVRFDPFTAEQGVRASVGGIEIPFSFELTDPRPVVQAVGGHGADRRSASVAPGSVAILRGTNLAAFSGEYVRTPLPIVLKGTSVAIDAPDIEASVAAPVLWVREDQIGIQIPWALAHERSAHLKVRAEHASTPFPFSLSAVAPEIVGVSESGRGYVHAVREDGSEVSLQAPARAGERVEMAMTGNGPVRFPVADGQLPAWPNPTVHEPTVTVGGQGAELVYSGLHLSRPGTYVVAFRVPQVLSAGDKDVSVAVADVSSNTVLMPVTN